MINKIKLELPHGLVVCQHYQAQSAESPLVIISNGSNGFYNYGMFPSLQEGLLKQEISSVTYNFSHGGVEDGLDSFTQLDLYEKNSMRLEVEDLYGIVKNKHIFNVPDNKEIFLMAHSLGGVPTIFTAQRLAKEDSEIKGVILVASVSTLNLYSKEIMENWEREGVWLMKNNRTNQMLPRGSEFLSEVKNADKDWNMQNAMSEFKTNYLIVNGDKDESVNPQHSIDLVEWAKNAGNKVEHIVIENASHTFNTKHPFETSTPELKQLIKSISHWVHEVEKETT